MTSAWKGSLIIVMFAIAFMGILQSPALGVQMTIEAIDDSGQSPGQAPYVTLVYASGPHVVTTQEVPNPWVSSSQASSYAGGIVPQNENWHFESAGNIWSSDLIVGDALTGLQTGVYRVSVMGGAFQYDSFNWSPYKGQWRWELHIQALRPIVNGEVMDYADYMLGSTGPYDTAALALQASLGSYIDIPLAEGGSMIFWIPDGTLGGDPLQRNTIDNLGDLTFNVTPIPEPSTLILAGTGLLFLAGRFRRSFTNLLTS